MHSETCVKTYRVETCFLSLGVTALLKAIEPLKTDETPFDDAQNGDKYVQELSALSQTTRTVRTLLSPRIARKWIRILVNLSGLVERRAS